MGDIMNKNQFRIMPLEERIVFDAAAAPVIYVNVHASTGGDGSSWAHALNNLQSALSMAATEAANGATSETIWVAAGKYSPGPNVTDAFTLPNNVSIYGGFAGKETTLAQRNPTSGETILTGDVLGNDLPGNPLQNATDPGYLASLADNNLHLLLASGVTATLDGLTVSDANNTTTVRGGALSGSHDNLTLNNMTFINNFTDGGGGGAIGLLDTTLLSSTLTITNSLFSNNTTSSAGGALRLNFDNLTLVNDVLSQNIGRGGAGGLTAVDTNVNISSSQFLGNIDINSDSSAMSITNNVNSIVSNISNTEYLNNHSGGGIGGAIDVVNFSPAATNTVNFDHCDFNGNFGPNFGGAVNYGRLVSGSITDSSFENNTSKWGGAISVGAPGFVTSGPSAADMILTRDTFTNNTATDMGGAIYNLNAVSMTISQSVFDSNTAVRYGGAIETDNINPSSVVPMAFSGGLFSISDSTLRNNTAADGGALSYRYQPITGFSVSQTTVSHDLFIGNSATLGSAYYQSGGISTVTRNMFIDKGDADPAGGLVAIDVGVSTVNNNLSASAIITSLDRSNLVLDSDDVITF